MQRKLKTKLVLFLSWIKLKKIDKGRKKGSWSKNGGKSKNNERKKN